jgi:hypothetical protein
MATEATQVQAGGQLPTPTSWLQVGGLSLGAGLLGTSLFVIVFGYWGVEHNARLYAMQALSWLYPRLREDIYLRFGSQDDYSLFSWLYAPLIQALGLEQAALVCSLLSLVALFAATYYLLSARLGWATALAGTLTVAIWTVPYSASALFNVAEPFATPRPLAAALGLLAVAWALRGRPLPASLAAALALLVHPLIAWPTLLLALMVYCRPSVAAILAVLGGLALVGGAWMGLPLLARLFLVMDPAWREVTEQLSGFLWTAQWTLADWNLVGVAVVSPLLVALRLDGRLRRLFLSAGIIGGLGVLMTLVFGDLLESLLILQVQPWRALWLAHWLGVAGMGLVLAGFATRRDKADLIAGMGLVGGELWISAGLPLLLMTAAALYAYASVPSDRIRGWLPLVMAACLALAILSSLPGGMATNTGMRELFIGNTLAMMAILGIFYLLIPRLGSDSLRRLVVGTAMMLVVVLAGLRIRQSLVLLQPNPETTPVVAGFPQQLPATGGILWEGDIKYPWYQLHYPSYLSRMQITGALFSREKLMEANRRAAHLEGILGPLALIQGNDMHLTLPEMGQAQIEQLCTDPALAAIYFSSPRSFPNSRAILNEQGAVIGTLVLCARTP